MPDTTTTADAADHIASSIDHLAATTTAGLQTATDMVAHAKDAIPAGLMDRLGDGMLNMFDKAGSVIAQYGPDAVHMALGYIRFTGIANIVEGFFYWGLCWLFYKLTSLLWFDKKNKQGERTRMALAKRWENGIEEDHNKGIGKAFCIVSTIILGIAGIIMFILGATDICNVWNWIKVFVPEVGLVHDVYTNIILTPPVHH